MCLAVQCAATLILEPQFELERVLKDVQKHRPQMFSGAPRIYNAIINSPIAQKYDLRSIEACLSGSAPLLVETHRRFVELTGAKLVEGYGLTEAAPVTHCNPIFGKGKQKVGTVGVPHPIKGEEVKAFVVLRPGTNATAEEIIAHCRTQLAPFKVPKDIEFRQSLPKTLIGKTLRRQLAEEDRKKRGQAAAKT